MNATNVINDIRAALIQTKSQGHDTVSIDAMENYLALLDKNIDNNSNNETLNHEKLLTEFKATNDRNIAHANSINSSNLEMFKAVTSAGQYALKSSMVINGGGAIALLAFTGKIWTTTTSSLIANSLTFSIFVFCIGVLLSAIASGTTYLSQLSFNINKYKTGNVINTISIVLILGAYVAFFCGAYIAGTSLGLHFSTNTVSINL